MAVHGNGRDGQTALAAAQVRIHGQYVKELSFASPIASAWVRGAEEAATVHIEIDLATKRVENDMHECAILVHAIARNSRDTVYDLKIVYAGLFELANVHKRAIEPVLNVNCPAVLFPSLRNIVGTLTHEGGVGALWLDPIDWAELFAQNAKDESPRGAAHSGRPIGEARPRP